MTQAAWLKQSGESSCQYVDFPVFGHQVGVVFTTDVFETTKRKFDIETTDAAAICYTYHNKAASVLIFNYSAGLGTLAHECSHAIWNLFKYHGVKLANEGLAYHLGYLVRRVYDLQFKARKAKRIYYAKQRNKK